jgi:hypothetical protein
MKSLAVAEATNSTFGLSASNAGGAMMTLMFLIAIYYFPTLLLGWERRA